MQPQESTEPARPGFNTVPERGSGDNLLRSVQQHHIQLSMMADTKANIIITVSSIVLTLVLGRLQDPELRTGLLVLGGFTLVALLLAILAVVPKYRPIAKNPGPLPPWFNIVFFGHFTSLDRERFIDEMAHAMAPGRAYETVVKDIYGMGLYLARHKYPYLRFSYLFFLSGFVLACVVQAVHLLGL